MRAHGFKVDQLAELVRIGIAAQTSENLQGEWWIEVRTLKITEAGHQALGSKR